MLVRCWNIFFFYAYDSLNRLVEQQVGSDERLTYEFNLLGQQTRIRQYVPANSSQAKDITYQYDSLSRVNQVTDANNRMLSYVYDKLNRRTRLTFPDSQYMQYGYDGDSRMTQVHYGAQMLASYTYDNLSQLQQVTYANGAQTQVDYSARGDITRLEHLFASSQHLGYQFTYNQVGQQQSKQHLGEASQWLPFANYGESYSTNNLHQYTQIGGDNYGFDSNGNLSSTSGYTYSHNSLNQLTQVTPNGNMGDIFTPTMHWGDETVKTSTAQSQSTCTTAMKSLLSIMLQVA